RREITVTDPEPVRQAVMEGEVGRVVVTHGPAADRVGRGRVLRREAVHAAAVDLGVSSSPRVVEVVDLAVRLLMEQSDLGGRVHRIRVPGGRRCLRGRLATAGKGAEVMVIAAVLLL